MSFYGQLEGCEFEILENEFAACFPGHGRIERLWTGARWAEGPAWFAAGRYLLWSDIPNNRMLRWDETNGQVATFRSPSNNSNGNTVDASGRLVSCEHLSRRVTRTNFDGSISILADRFDGKRFNSPNDLVVKKDGSIWFTDPSYGINSDYEGDKAKSELPCQVYRIDPTGLITVVADDFVMPNGLAFSPDEKFLYIADSGIVDKPTHIRRFSVDAEGSALGGGEIFAECTAGVFDGFRFDTDGRIWTSAADGVHCYNTAGQLIGKIRIPELVANLTFGGAKRNRLFICGTTSIYAVYLKVNGCTAG